MTTTLTRLLTKDEKTTTMTLVVRMGMEAWGVKMMVVAIVFASVLLTVTESARVPPVPKKVRARAISAHVVKLRWRDPVKNKGRATRFYSVRYSSEDDAENDYQFAQSADTRVRVSKLRPNTTYVFSVRTVAGKKGSPWSREVTATTAPVEHRVVTKLKALPLSSKSVRLSWKRPKVTNETLAYTVLWAEHEQKDSQWMTALVSNRSKNFTVDDLRPHTLYSFRVQTMLAEGSGGRTEKSLARTFSDKPAKAPRNVALKYSNESYILVKWRPPGLRQRNGVLLGYKIQYKRKGSRRGDVCTVITKAEDNHYVLADMTRGERYKVRVAAMTVNGTGPFSKWDTVNVPLSSDSQPVRHKKYDDYDNYTRNDGAIPQPRMAPTAPQNLRVVDMTSTAINITWSQPVGHECCPIIAYRITTWNQNTSDVEGETMTGNSREARVSFLKPDTVYNFTISAYSKNGESQVSQALSVHTLQAEPPSILWVHSSPVVAGASANFSCVVRAEPPPEVSWFGPNQSVPYSPGRITNLMLHGKHGIHVRRRHNSVHDVTTHLLMDHVTADDSGVYTCSATNIAGTVTSPVTLQVHEAPSVESSQGAQVMEGQGTQLQCVVRGVPLPTVVWLRQNSDIMFQETPDEQLEENAATTTTPSATTSTTTSTPSTPPYVTSEVGEGGKVRRSFLHFPHTSLHHQGVYLCLARSVAGTNESKVQLTVQIPPPPAVQNLRAIAMSPESVSVVWDRPFSYNYSIDGYRVSYRPLTSGQTRYLDTTFQKQDIKGLLPRQRYIIGVTPFNSHSLGDSGSEVMVTTLTNQGLQPANVSAVALNSSMIQLDWASPQNIDRMYIRGYNLYYKRENDTQQEMLFIEGNRNKQFLIGLGRDETYYLRIATLTTWGYEAPSQWIRIQKHPLELFPPVTPTQVKAVETLDSIRVTWTSSDEPASKKSPLLGYRMIYGPVDSPSEINRVDLEASATQFTIRGLNASTKYIIALRAYNKYAVSEPVYLRATTKAQPPSTVLKATAVALSPTEIHVHWKPPLRGHVTKYQLRYWRPGKRDKQSAWLMSPTTDYVAGSLKPHSQYRFEIIPFSGEVIGEGSVIFADSLPSKPDAPPSSVAMMTINATHMLVTWKAPPAGKQNGPISAYKIIMKKKGGPRLAKFTVDGNRFNYTFSNLKPNSTYKIRMAAINSNGTGPYTGWVVGRTEKLELRQPDTPQAMAVTSSARSMVITWTSPADHLVPVMGYIVGYGRYIPEVYRYILGPRERRYVIADLKPSTEYIVSVRAFNSIGESYPEFKVAQTLSAPLEVKLEVPVKLRVIPLSPTSVGLSWLDPSLFKRPPPPTPSPPSSSSSSSSSSASSSSAPSSASSIQPTDGRLYLIRYSAISGEKYLYLNTTTTFLNVTGLEVATSYEFAVRTTLEGQESGWSLPVVQTTQQTAPSSPPREVTVVASLSRSSLVVNWTAPLFPNGDIKEYIVYYTSNPVVDTKLWMIKTSKRKSTTVDDVMPYTPYYIRVQARNAAGYGPLSATVTYSPPSDSRAAPSEVRVWSLQRNISTAVEVMWQAPALPMGHITGYMVYYTMDNDEHRGPSWMIQRERGLSALILGLSLNATYRFKVRPRYGASLGPFSETVNFTTPKDDSSNAAGDTTTLALKEYTSEMFDLDDTSSTTPPPPEVNRPTTGSDLSDPSLTPVATTTMGANQFSPYQVSSFSQPISSQEIVSSEQSSPITDNDTSDDGSTVTVALSTLETSKPVNSEDEEMSVSVSYSTSSISSSSPPSSSSSSSFTTSPSSSSSPFPPSSSSYSSPATTSTSPTITLPASSSPSASSSSSSSASPP